ncbi:MAG TPA: thioesterase family protein [Dehalococcoidia bacterium]|nr:thioesterase family protein [Dehalococcoidia bacterium]
MSQSPEAGSRPLEVELALPVRSYDIDFAGIVSNFVYVRWLEDLRLCMLAEHLPLPDQVEEGYVPILLSTHVDYHRALRMFDEPVGRMWLSGLGRLRWTVEAEIVIGNVRAATATQTGVFLRLGTLRPVATPAHLRAKFEQAGGRR